ncbi:MAG: toprim domain-containing protein, partial [Burkholderiales bacterium]
GVYNAVTGHEFFRGRIVVPVVAADGEIGTLYGRAIGKLLHKDERHRFMPGPQAGVFNPAALAAETLRESQGALILAEGILDALTWWRHGWKNVTTCFSARRPSPDVIDALVKAGVRVAVLAFDPDGAGEHGTESAAALLIARGVECRRVRVPHGHDANSYALAVTPPRQALAVLLNAAEFLGKGKVSAVAAPSSDASRASSSLAAQAAQAADVAAPEIAPPVPPTKPEEAARKETLPPVASSAPTLAPRGEHWFLELDGREWRVGGMDKLAGADALKLAVRLRVGEAFHLDTIDLARDLDRRRFVERAAEETRLHTDLLRRDVGRLLLAVETTVAARAAQAAQAATENAGAAVVLSPEEKAEALAWAQGPELIARLKDAGRRAGVVGEESNSLLGYLCCVSRLLDKPLAAILQ